MSNADWLDAEEARVAADKAETMSAIFPYPTVSSWFEEHGDFPENFVDGHNSTCMAVSHGDPMMCDEDCTPESPAFMDESRHP